MKQNESEKKSIRVLLEHGRRFFRNRCVDTQTFESDIKKAIDRSMRLEFYEGVVEGYQVLALLHMHGGAYDMAYSALKMSEAFIAKFDVGTEARLNLYNTFVIYYMDYIGDAEAGASMCKKGIDLARESGNTEMLMKLTANLGILSLAFNDFIHGKAYLELANTYYKSINDEIRVMYCNCNIGEAFIGLEDYEAAEKAFNEAMTSAVALREDVIIEDAAVGLCQLYRLNQDFPKAIEILEETLKKLEDNHLSMLGGKILLELIDLYVTLDDYVMADIRMEMFETIKEAMNHSGYMLKYTALKSQIAIGFGDYKLAYEKGKAHYDLYLEENTTKANEIVGNMVAGQLTKTIERLETIGNIGRKLTCHIDGNNILDTLFEELSPLMTIDSIGLGIIENDKISYAYYQQDLNEKRSFMSQLDDSDSLAAWSIEHKKPVMINDLSAEYSLYIPKLQKKINHNYGKQVQSVIYVPLMVEEVVQGVLTLQSYKTMTYSSEDLETLKVIGSYVAISVLNNQQAEALRRLSFWDQLTGLRNRTGLQHVYNRYEEKTVKSIDILMMDVDRFKRFNDMYGHLIGDQVLSVVGDLLLPYDNDDDVTVNRLGGEEFVVMFFNQPKGKALKIADEILSKVQDISIPYRGISLKVTISIGYYRYEGRMLPILDHMYKYADRALYRAKNAGRNCVVSYE